MDAVAQLLCAAMQGDELNFSHALADRRASIDAKDAHGETALMQAAKRGHRTLVAQALAAGANPNAESLASRTPLWFAVSGGHIAVVEMLLDAGASLDCGSGSVNPTLLCAFQNNHADVLDVLLAATQRLLETQANVNCSGYEVLSLAVRDGGSDAMVATLLASLAQGPRETEWNICHTLMRAAQANQVDLIQKLLPVVADMTQINWNDFEPLVYASEFGYTAIVSLLLIAGADVNATDGHEDSALTAAIRWKRTSIVEMLLAVDGLAIDYASMYGNTALLLAAERGPLDTMKMLLAAGANAHHINTHGETALILSSWAGHFDIVEMLLGVGVDVDQENPRGFTPLLCATSAPIVEALLTNGQANVHHINADGESALFCSARSGDDASTLDVLLAHGADINHTRADGTTALMIACSNDSGPEDSRADCVERLLVAGADTNCSDSDGYTALLRAAEDGEVAIVEMLLRHSVNVNHVNHEGHNARVLCGCARSY